MAYRSTKRFAQITSPGKIDKNSDFDSITLTKKQYANREDRKYKYRAGSFWFKTKKEANAHREFWGQFGVKGRRRK